MTGPAHHAAHRLARRALAARDRGVGPANLAALIRTYAPADLRRGPNGVSLRCYGLETPPMPDRRAAITTWALMALEQEGNA